MSLCYSDIIWEILLILNLIIVANNVGQLSFVDSTLLIFLFIAASVSTGIPALLAYCTYLSLIWSEDWLIKRKVGILIYSVLLLIIVGLMYDFIKKQRRYIFRLVDFYSILQIRLADSLRHISNSSTIDNDLSNCL